MDIKSKYKIIKRKSGNMVGLHVELNHSLISRLDMYCEKYDKSKSDIISEALLIWLNNMDSGRY